MRRSFAIGFGVQIHSSPHQPHSRYRQIEHSGYKGRNTPTFAVAFPVGDFIWHSDCVRNCCSPFRLIVAVPHQSYLVWTDLVPYELGDASFLIGKEETRYAKQITVSGHR